MEMVPITITRDSGYTDRLRAYQVLVDSEIIGKVQDGETKEFMVSPGQHRISLRIDWCGSNVIDFAAVQGIPITFEARSNLRGGKVILAIWFALFQRNSYLLLEQSVSIAKSLS